MDDGVDLRMGGEQRVHGLAVAQVHIDEGDLFAADLFHAAQGLLAGIVQVVRHQNFIAGVRQLNAGVAANVACAARNQNSFHKKPTFLSFCLY